MYDSESQEAIRKRLTRRCWVWASYGTIALAINIMLLVVLSWLYEMQAAVVVPWLAATILGVLVVNGVLNFTGDDLSSRLWSELIVHKNMVDQGLVDQRLTELAVECQRASDKTNRLRSKFARSRSEDPALKQSFLDAEADFAAKHAAFFEFCAALASQGYEVRTSPDNLGRPSFKLYLPEPTLAKKKLA